GPGAGAQHVADAVDPAGEAGLGKALHQPLQGTQMRLGESRLVNAGPVRADCTQCVKIGENARAVDAREMVCHGFTYLRARSSPGVNKVPNVFCKSRTKFRDRPQ